MSDKPCYKLLSSRHAVDEYRRIYENSAEYLARQITSNLQAGFVLHGPTYYENGYHWQAVVYYPTQK